MVTLIATTVVPAPVDQTAAFVLDLSHDQEWRPEVVSMELDPPGPARVGQRNVDQMRWGPLPLTVRAEVVDVGPTSFTIHGHGSQMTMRIHRSVSPHPDGSEVTARIIVQQHGILRLLGAVRVGRHRAVDTHRHL
jgi:carbon monoxide dehydrogenase subunit G